MKLLSSADIRAIEQAAVDGGLEFLRLMENAGSAAARIIRSSYTVAAKSVVILCGRGNNGGDGFVIARKLCDEGAAVTVILTSGMPKSEDAIEMFSRIQQSDITFVSLENEPYVASDCVRNASLIIDAVYGIGFSGALPDYLRSLFRIVNACTAPLVAIDVPSGMDTDSGETDPDALKADLTITFTAMKKGLVTPSGAPMCGKIQVAAIGIDDALLELYIKDEAVISLEMVRHCFPARQADSHKGDFGRLLTLCGNRGMMGAAILSIRAALRCGTGLVVSALPRSLYPLAAAALNEPVYSLLEETENGDFSLSARAVLHEQMQPSTALLIGCGLGTSEGACALVLDCLVNSTKPIVLDADGINLVAQHIHTLKTVHAPLVLTPHPGEMARLTGLSIAEVQANRLDIARRFAEEYGVTLVLKGYNTLIAAPGQPVLTNTTGNPGMSTGGSGDVLAGMIAAFLAQGMSPRNAALCGVHLHGLAGDQAAARLSQHFMLPSDIIDELSKLFLILENRS